MFARNPGQKVYVYAVFSSLTIPDHKGRFWKEVERCSARQRDLKPALGWELYGQDFHFLLQDPRTLELIFKPQED